MKSILLNLSLILVIVPGFSQKKFISSVHFPDTTKKIIRDEVSVLSEVIKASELKPILEFLASDSCEGRELGTRGNDRAAEYLASKFNDYGIQKIGNKGDYFQQVGFKWISWKNINVEINGFPYKNIWDFVSLPTDNEDLNFNLNEIVFLGYGIESSQYNDYKNVNVKDKVILIYNGEPFSKKGLSYVNGKTTASIWSESLELKLMAAKKNGVKCVFIIEDKFKELVDAKRALMLSPTVLLDKDETAKNQLCNSIHLSSSMAVKLLGKSLKKAISTRDKIQSKGKPRHFNIKQIVKIEQEREIGSVTGRNIMGYIEGTDKKNEILILTAHYDHIGMRGKDVFNGADDNASGTSTLTQIARAFQVAKNNGKGPRRSVLCLLLTGEEKGLLGSMYYVGNPRFPLQQTIADINMDMVGRIDEKYKPNGKYIYVIGSDRLSSELHLVNEKVNNDYSHLIMDYTYNGENDPNKYYYRSDHYNFAEKGIPAIFFFNGTHEDYHRIGDDAWKIDYNKMELIGRHIFILAWELANRDHKISRDNN